MMARFRLVGEGPDDVAVFVALVNRYGLPLAEKGKEAPDKLVIDFPGGDVAVLRKLRDIDDEDQWLLEHVRTLLKPADLTGEDRFGIVVDADHPKAADPDDGFRRRWVQVSENLRNLGYSDVPEEPDPSGTVVGANQSDRPWVGVWMMPDNRSPGKLEDFAQRLVKAGDEGLWDYAGQAAAGACLSLRACERIGLKSAESGERRRKPSIRSSLLPSALRIPYSLIDSFTASQGARFAPKDQAKAHVHTFLAWHEVPGVPMGLAITKKFLDADSPDARSFVAWLCRLYGLASPRLATP
jgi:hypothetical protein